MSQLNILFETDELSEFFETGTSINEMKQLIFHLLKEQRKSQQINSNKLSHSLVAQELDKASVVKTIPSNSGLPIAKTLTNLTIDEMLETVLSNSFVPDYVTKNTIIWENWDIFQNLSMSGKSSENVRIG